MGEKTRGNRTARSTARTAEWVRGEGGGKGTSWVPREAKGEKDLGREEGGKNRSGG